MSKKPALKRGPSKKPCVIVNMGEEMDEKLLQGRDYYDVLDEIETLFTSSGIRVSRDEEPYQICIEGGVVKGATVVSMRQDEAEGIVVRFSVAVEEESRRTGIAKELISSLMRDYKQLDGDMLEAWVVNPGMVPLLNSLGFEEPYPEWSENNPMFTYRGNGPVLPKTIEEEISSPLTKPARLQEIWEIKIKGRRKYPQVLQNPGCSLETLLQGAIDYPEIVELNQALALLMLERPMDAVKLAAKLRDGWLWGGFMHLPPLVIRQLAVRFAERVLYLIPEYLQADAKAALDAARNVENHDASARAEMGKLSATVRAHARRHDGKTSDMKAAGYALDAVADASSFNLAPMRPVRQGETQLGTYVVNVPYSVDRAIDQATRWDSYQLKKGGATEASDKATLAEQLWEVEQVREARAQVLRDAAAKAKRHTKLKGKIRHSGEHEAEAQEALEKEVQIQAAVKQAQESSEKIRAIISTGVDDDWAPWIGLGLVAAGTVACLLIGPEIFAGAAVGAGLAELGVVSLTEAELSLSAGEATAELVAAVDASGIATVSLGEVEAAATLGEMISAQDAAFLAEIIERLQAARPAVTVITAAAEAILRMPK